MTNRRGRLAPWICHPSLAGLSFFVIFKKTAEFAETLGQGGTLMKNGTKKGAKPSHEKAG